MSYATLPGGSTIVAIIVATVGDWCVSLVPVNGWCWIRLVPRRYRRIRTRLIQMELPKMDRISRRPLNEFVMCVTTY